MFTRSLLGPQPLAKWKSSPSYGFGKGSRDTREKVYISKDHSKGVYGRHSPGPAAHQLRPSTGPQMLSTKQSQPQWAFAAAQRFPQSKFEDTPGPGAYEPPQELGKQFVSKFASQPVFGFGSAEQRSNWKVFISEEHNAAFYGRDSPGPLAYGSRSTMGKQELSTMRTPPVHSFGSSKRAAQPRHLKRASESPGPAAYSLGPSVGKQVLSKLRSASTPSFGKGEQMHNPKVYVSEEINRSFYGRVGPGPTTATQMPSFARQPLSRVRTAPQWGFGKVRADAGAHACREGNFLMRSCVERAVAQATRFKEKTLENAPGPGAYCV